MIKNETNDKYYIRFTGKTWRTFKDEDDEIILEKLCPLKVPYYRNNPVYVECSNRCLTLLDGFLLPMIMHADVEWSALQVKCRKLIEDEDVKNGPQSDLYTIKEILNTLDRFEDLFKEECSRAYSVEETDDDFSREFYERCNWNCHHSEYYLRISIIRASTVKETEEKYKKHVQKDTLVNYD